MEIMAEWLGCRWIGKDYTKRWISGDSSPHHMPRQGFRILRAPRTPALNIVNLKWRYLDKQTVFGHDRPGLAPHQGWRPPTTTWKEHTNGGFLPPPITLTPHLLQPKWKCPEYRPQLHTRQWNTIPTLKDRQRYQSAYMQCPLHVPRGLFLSNRQSLHDTGETPSGIPLVYQYLDHAGFHGFTGSSS